MNAQVQTYLNRDHFSGGVLEAEGLVSIKLRMKEQRALMERLDEEMQQLKSLPAEERTAAMRAREELLAPIYHTVAVHFADLHDTPVRMKDKMVIEEVIPWREARARLYWRIKRRLLEGALKHEIGDDFGHGQKSEMLRRWFIEDRGDTLRYLWDQDVHAVEWLEVQVDHATRKRVVRENMKALKRDQVVRKFKTLLEEMCPDDLHEAGVHLAQKLSASKRQEFLNSVSGLVSKDVKEEEDDKAGSKSSDSSENGES